MNSRYLTSEAEDVVWAPQLRAMGLPIDGPNVGNTNQVAEGNILGLMVA